jgi:3-phenylpropionate/trans-cinnamate dioxygenase ferredoxin subunit
MTDVARFALADLAPGAALRLRGAVRGGICVVRIGDDYYALGDRCSHADVSLAEGDIDPEARTIECWKHGSAFSLVTGEPQSLPATKPVTAYRVVVDGDHAVVRDA